METATLISVCAMIRQAHNLSNTKAVREWAEKNGKRQLITWSIIRAKIA